jgi:hypothetical protein
MSAEAGASVAPEAGATESGAAEPPQAELSESEPEEEVVSEVASAARTDAVRVAETIGNEWSSDEEEEFTV